MTDPRATTTVWCLSPEELALEGCAGPALLSPSERREWREAVPSPRVAARWLLRYALSRELDVAPWDFAFDYMQNGQPFIRGPKGSEAPRFSVSHTRGMVVCGIAWSGRIGVDTERLCRRAAVLESGDPFSESELRALDELEAAARGRRRIELWTLKEAYAKAVGIGLALDFAALSFRFDGLAVTAEIARSVPGCACPWQFACYALGDRHAVSLALECADGVDGPPVCAKRWFSASREARA